MEDEEPTRKKVRAAANERVKSALRGIAAGEPALSERVEKCLDSVTRYPLEIEAARECKLLKGFNDDIVAKLEAKLKTVTGNVSSFKSEECNASAGCMEWDVSFIARRDSSESAASECDVAESAVPDTSRDEEVAARLSQEWNGAAKQRNEYQVAKDHELALKLQLQMEEEVHQGGHARPYMFDDVKVGKLSDAFKDPENARDASEEFPDDAFEGDNVFDNIRRQGGLQRFIGDSNGGGEPSSSSVVVPPRAAFSPVNLSISSLSDDDSPDERKTLDESSVNVTPPPTIPSPKKRKAGPAAAKPKVKKKSLKEILEGDPTMPPSAKKKNRPAKTRIATAPVSRAHAISDSDDDEPTPSTSRGISKHVPLIGSQPETISDDDDEEEQPRMKKVIKKRCGTGGRKKKECFDFNIDQSNLPEWFHSEAPRRGTERSGNGGEGSRVPKGDGGGFVLEPGCFDVVLLVDNREVIGGGAGGKESRKQVTASELQALNVPNKIICLNIGDFAWAAVEKSTKGRMLVLPYVLERKRIDDLFQSITSKEGRYYEQKQRIIECGIRHKWYLVENFYKAKIRWTLQERRANGGEDEDKGSKNIQNKVTMSAVAGTGAGGFNLVETTSQKESVEFLAAATECLKNKYEGRRLYSHTSEDGGAERARDDAFPTFQSFNESGKKRKPLKAWEVFARMLMQISGVPWPMAEALTKKYPTPAALMEAYDECAEDNRGSMIVGFEYGGGKRVNKGVSEAIAALYNYRGQFE